MAEAMKLMNEQTQKRLPLYLCYLRSIQKKDNCPQNISSSAIAAALGLNSVLVRKDLASVSGGGRPKTGYVVRELASDIEAALGRSDIVAAALVGVGNLGKAILGYEGFLRYGFDISVAFDKSHEVAGMMVGGKCVQNTGRMAELCRTLGIAIGIIAVPAKNAQAACDALVSSGVCAIWNFAPAKLQAPEGVFIKNEDIGTSLVELTGYLAGRDAQKAE